MIYFDQAATSFPKPQQVIDAVTNALTKIGGSGGRGTHETAEITNTLISETRQKAAHLFGCSKADHVLFFSNATVGLNQAIKGMDLQKGDHVIATHFEHNSVRRPLKYLEETIGINITHLEWPDIQATTSLQQQFTNKTKLLVMSHGSNVTGDVLPIDEMAAMAKKHGVLVLVDASQTAGHMPLNMEQSSIDMLAFPGHKGLMGPQGTGLLLVDSDFNLIPLHHGGTGRHSEPADQPEAWPERYESGTLNLPGIAGLNAALEVYEQRREENVPRETILARRLRSGLEQISNVVIYSPESDDLQLPIVAFNIRGIDSQEIAMILDSHYDIAVRAGLHCSPLAHMSLNTLESGVVRASLGVYNTKQEVDTFIKALNDIVTAYAEL